MDGIDGGSRVVLATLCRQDTRRLALVPESSNWPIVMAMASLILTPWMTYEDFPLAACVRCAWA